MAMMIITRPRNASIEEKREPGVEERCELVFAAESMRSDIVPHSGQNVRSTLSRWFLCSPLENWLMQVLTKNYYAGFTSFW